MAPTNKGLSLPFSVKWKKDLTFIIYGFSYQTMNRVPATELPPNKNETKRLKFHLIHEMFYTKP